MGIKLFASIDQQAEARQAGLELRETTLVIFGSPIAGTPVMAASPLAAVDLPLKVVIWAGDDGKSKISYVTPAALAARHRLSADLAKNLGAIEILTRRSRRYVTQCPTRAALAEGPGRLRIRGVLRRLLTPRFGG